MLKEVSCDQFKENGDVRLPIRFHKGLNAIIGSSDGANSIGKSTFLMIIDFIFGGNDYAKKATDIIENIGSHTIKFEFEFQGKPYYFSRNTDEHTTIWECDKNYHPKKSWSIEDYCHFLQQQYNMPVLPNHFRSAISPFIRVWGRPATLNQEKPFKASIDSPDKQGIQALLELFNRYQGIKEQLQAIDSAKEKKRVFLSAQKYKFIATVDNKTQFNDNEKRIQELEQELQKLTRESNNGLIDLDSLQAQQLSGLRRQLSEARKHRTRLLAQKKSFESEHKPNNSRLVQNFAALQQFFPTVDIKKISDIEQFHQQLTGVLKREYKEADKELQLLINNSEKQINELEEKIMSLNDIPNVSWAILEQFAELQKETTQLRDSNQNFLTKELLKKDIQQLQQSFDALMKNILKNIESILNDRMKLINDSIYHGEKTSPELSLSSATQYHFHTPRDRGTGSEYKGLIVLDLAMLETTSIPIVAHDSVLLKQIQDTALEGILSKYVHQDKQVFIALDKATSYSEITQKILEESEVLRLFPNGGELYGCSWNNIK